MWTLNNFVAEDDGELANTLSSDHGITKILIAHLLDNFIEGVEAQPTG